MDWRSIVSGIAPVLGTALGGPLGRMAMSAVATAVTGNPAATEKQIASAFDSMTPETLTALKKCENDFAVRIKELDIDVDKLHAADTADARKAGAERAKSATWWMEPVLALLAVGGFFAACGGLIYVATQNLTLDPQAHDIIVMLLGVLAAKFSDVYGYFFGSSSGSRQKNEMLADKND